MAYDANVAIARVSERYASDVYFYSGPISDPGFAELIRMSMRPTRRRNCLLILVTNGGSGKTAYRIAHFLQTRYEKLIVCAPSHCKSAGTLIALAGHTIIIDAFSELGPLDIMSSNLPGSQEFVAGDASAVVQLLALGVETVRVSSREIAGRGEAGLSVQQAGQLALGIVGQLLTPLFAQLSARRIGQELREQDAAGEYAQRLADKSRNLQPNALTRLTRRYPIHDFLIDQDEAKALFVHIEAPAQCLYALIDSLGDAIYQEASTPHVIRLDTNMPVSAVPVTPQEGGAASPVASADFSFARALRDPGAGLSPQGAGEAEASAQAEPVQPGMPMPEPVRQPQKRSRRKPSPAKPAPRR